MLEWKFKLWKIKKLIEINNKKLKKIFCEDVKNKIEIAYNKNIMKW